MSEIMQTLPLLRPLIEPLIGLPYEQYNCERLCAYLLREGWGIDVDAAEPERLSCLIREVWWKDDDIPFHAIIHPWDVLIFSQDGESSSHVGIVNDDCYLMVHTARKIGVCLSPWQRLAHKILQVGRLSHLESP